MKVSPESNPYQPPETQIAAVRPPAKSGVVYLVIGIGLFLVSIVVQGYLFLYESPQVLKRSEELDLEVPQILVVVWDIVDFCWEYWLVYCLPPLFMLVVSEWRFKVNNKRRVRYFIGITLGVCSVAVTILLILGILIANWQLNNLA